MNVKKVKALNEKIEAINKKKTKEESKREVLMSNLEKNIEAYEKAYGVKLKGTTLAKTVANIEKEMKKVSSDITEEYELKEAVVNAIDSGDIDEANRLLGITPQNVVEEDTEFEDGIEVSEDTSFDEDDEFEEDIEVSEDTDFDEDLEEDFEDDFGYEEEDGSFEEISSEDFADSEDEDDWGDFAVDDDDEVEESNLGSSVDATVKELDSGSDMFDDVSDDDDFGFGDMLSGSRFDI